MANSRFMNHEWFREGSDSARCAEEESTLDLFFRPRPSLRLRKEEKVLEGSLELWNVRE